MSDERKTFMVAVRFPLRLRDHLWGEARRRGVTVSDVVRDAVDATVKPPARRATDWTGVRMIDPPGWEWVPRTFTGLSQHGVTLRWKGEPDAN